MPCASPRVAAFLTRTLIPTLRSSSVSARFACTTSPPDMSPTAVSDLRVNYTAPSPFPYPLPSSPHTLFSSWFEAAVASSDLEPNAMCLSTVTPCGRPSARMVLLKGVSEKGFVFFTNYQSHKAKQLFSTPFAALTFWWPTLERSVRIEGEVEKVSGHESDKYFYSRPASSRLGAWVSDQSREVKSREVLECRLKELEEEYLHTDGNEKKVIDRPPHWGGFRVRPDRIEFWKGREARLHDRLLYTKEGDGWKTSRLQP